MQKISSASINYNAQWATSPHTHTHAHTHNEQEKCLYCTHKSVLNCFTAGAQRERMLTLPLHVALHCKCLCMCRWTKEQDQTKSLTIGACMHLYFCTTCLSATPPMHRLRLVGRGFWAPTIAQPKTLHPIWATQQQQQPQGLYRDMYKPTFIPCIRITGCLRLWEHSTKTPPQIFVRHNYSFVHFQISSQISFL